jgi:hypothetical protein
MSDEKWLGGYIAIDYAYLMEIDPDNSANFPIDIEAG